MYVTIDVYIYRFIINSENIIVMLLFDCRQY